MSLISDIFSVKNEYPDNRKRKVIRVLGTKIRLKKGDTPVYRTVNYVIKMLKQYNIKNIISSPGCQNSLFNLLVQQDDFFKCYSVSDERSAAYMAIGIAEELNEPVVITCTGSNASRNWVPALTEAYYKSIPIIAMPFYNRASNEFNLAAQYTNRKITQEDIKALQVKLPEISDNTDRNQILTYLNAAFLTAKYNFKPVIVECPSNLGIGNLNTYKKFPSDVWSSEVKENITDETECLKNRNFAIFIGSHKKFTSQEENAISNFAKSWNVPVFCDHTSNYTGSNKILTGRAKICDIKKPDLLIDIGGVSGDVSTLWLFAKCDIWRINSKNERTFKFRYDRAVSKIFLMSENEFFAKCTNTSESVSKYYDEVKNKIETAIYPELPLCNYLIIQNLTKYIPQGSVLHHGVSNTKRAINCFNFKDNIEISSNVGTCGIDGSVSVLVGHSLAAFDKNVFGVMGDLTFFYDMNALQNREIKNNLRILLINNNKGIEFKINGLFENMLDETEKLIGASGHHTTADGWAQSCGFHYMSANTKEDFLAKIQDFCTKKFDKPVLFEVFTKDEDEITASNLMKEVSKNEKN